MIRSFIAIELPQEVIEKLKGIEDRLKSTQAGVKWVNPSSIHLTLKFLGSIEEGMITRVTERAGKIARMYAPFSLSVGGIGTFPPGRSARIVWVGVKEKGGSLLQLQEQIEEEMNCLGFKREERRFTPHLTLGRIKSTRGKDELARSIEENKGIELGNFLVESIHLFKSDLRPQGAIYTKLKSFMLNLP